MFNEFFCQNKFIIEKYIKFIIKIYTYKIYEQKQKKKNKAARMKNLIKKLIFKEETNLIYIKF
jgi:hypothetical protein